MALCVSVCIWMLHSTHLELTWWLEWGLPWEYVQYTDDILSSYDGCCFCHDAIQVLGICSIRYSLISYLSVLCSGRIWPSFIKWAVVLPRGFLLRIGIQYVLSFKPKKCVLPVRAQASSRRISGRDFKCCGAVFQQRTLQIKYCLL